MNRTIDVRAEMHKLGSSKPVHAAAGIGALASEALRDLQVRFGKWRSEASVNSMSKRAGGYVSNARTRASAEYDKLAKRGQKALNGRGTGHAKGALNGNSSQKQQSQQSHSRSTGA